jgi:uncharacterized protein DUF2505
MTAIRKARFEYRHECSPETFWTQVYFDPEFTRRLHEEELGCVRYRLVSIDETRGVVRRVIEVTPKVFGVAPILDRMFGGNYSYREETTFDRSGTQANVVLTPNKHVKTVSAKGLFNVRPLESDRSIGVYEFDLEVRAPGVGALIEHLVLHNIELACEAAARLTNEFAIRAAGDGPREA